VRFLAEHVFAGVDGGFEHGGVEVRAGRNHHRIHAAGEDFLIRVEPDEAMVILHLDLVRLGLGKLLAAGFDPLFEDIRHRNQADIFARVHRIAGRLRAASAAADEADLDDIAAGGMTECDPARERGGGSEKIAARGKWRQRGLVWFGIHNRTAFGR
jgi:hypothetical protein